MVKVLIVEDDYELADTVEEMLAGTGFEICGVAADLCEALQLREHFRPELSMIDLHLSDGEDGTEIAAELLRRGRIGVLYATGDPHHRLLRSAVGEGCIAKPYSGRSLLSALRIVSAVAARQATTDAFPPGFRLLNSTGAAPP